MNYPGIEKGYAFIASLGKRIGLDYNLFLLLSYIALFIVFIALYKKIQYWHIIIIGYLTFPIFYDATQVRFFMATMIYLIAVAFLAQNKRLIYIVLVILAASFHKSFLALLALVYISPEKVMSNKISKRFFEVIIIISGVIFFTKSRLPFLTYLINIAIGDNESKNIYFETTTRFGFLYSTLFQIINIFLCKMGLNYLEDNSSGSDDVNFVRTVYDIVLTTTFALPLVMINVNFARYFRLNNILVLACMTMVYMYINIWNCRNSIRIGARVTATQSFYWLIGIGNFIYWRFFILDSNLPEKILAQNIYIK